MMTKPRAYVLKLLYYFECSSLLLSLIHIFRLFPQRQQHFLKYYLNVHWDRVWLVTVFPILQGQSVRYYCSNPSCIIVVTLSDKASLLSPDISTKYVAAYRSLQAMSSLTLMSNFINYVFLIAFIINNWLSFVLQFLF